VIEQGVDRERPNRDRAITVCKAQGALVVVREVNDQLSAIVCRDLDAPCQKLQLASEVEHFSVLANERGALIAYAGKAAAQVRVRSIDSERGTLGPERIPAACWSKTGLCSTPTLARVGRRIVLAAPEQTDLLMLESADEGESFSAPPVL
jgi:hypothetical protein